MPLSIAPGASHILSTIPSLSFQNVLNCKNFQLKNVEYKAAKRFLAVSNSTPNDGIGPMNFDVSFPFDYSELLEQAKEETDIALKDGIQLMEIEFPTAGLDSVPGDGEGGIEMTGSMQLIREFCDLCISPEKVTKTRIFFPEANEVEFARNSAFAGASFKLDYLTKPSFFEDFGFTTKIKMADRVKPEDELFLAAYPYFNVSEMLVVDELYKEAVQNTDRKLIIFNGELDRIRSGYYPPFFYPKLAALTKTLLPKMESIYYIHNFKGLKGGTLFRSPTITKTRFRHVYEQVELLSQFGIFILLVVIGVIQVPGKSLRKLGTSISAYTSRKRCPHSKKLHWIFFPQIKL